jgi:hypothetical protein
VGRQIHLLVATCLLLLLLLLLSCRAATKAKIYGTGGGAAPATCNRPCPGNSAWACGGTWANNLYRITTSSERWDCCHAALGLLPRCAACATDEMPPECLQLLLA